MRKTHIPDSDGYLEKKIIITLAPEITGLKVWKYSIGCNWCGYLLGSMVPETARANGALNGC